MEEYLHGEHSKKPDDAVTAEVSDSEGVTLAYIPPETETRPKYVENAIRDFSAHTHGWTFKESTADHPNGCAPDCPGWAEHCNRWHDSEPESAVVRGAVIWGSELSPDRLPERDTPGGLFQVTRWEVTDGKLTLWWAAVPVRPRRELSEDERRRELTRIFKGTAQPFAVMAPDDEVVAAEIVPDEAGRPSMASMRPDEGRALRHSPASSGTDPGGNGPWWPRTSWYQWVLPPVVAVEPDGGSIEAINPQTVERLGRPPEIAPTPPTPGGRAQGPSE